jgi:hypothetical protein
MFVLRGIAVSLTFFVLLYCLLSVLVVCGWRGAMRFCGASARGRENMLFWFRVFPLLASAAVTLALAVPSFVLLEPRSIDEEMGVPLVLGFNCLVLLGFGLFRVVVAQRRSSRVVGEWLKGAKVLDAGVTGPTVQASRKSPPLALVGVCAPKVVVSEATVALLTPPELRVAVRHEVAHMRSRDNLKKLVFHCSPFPGMASLEAAWQEAAELAADDAAVSNFREALDLAATLIKLSRRIPVTPAPVFTMTLVSGAGSVRVRVERLLAWDESRALDVHKPWLYAIPVLVAILGAAVLYSPILAQTHRVTEWLVR